MFNKSENIQQQNAVNYFLNTSVALLLDVQDCLLYLEHFHRISLLFLLVNMKIYLMKNV